MTTWLTVVGLADVAVGLVLIAYAIEARDVESFLSVFCWAFFSIVIVVPVLFTLGLWRRDVTNDPSRASRTQQVAMVAMVIGSLCVNLIAGIVVWLMLRSGSFHRKATYATLVVLVPLQAWATDGHAVTTAVNCLGLALVISGDIVNQHRDLGSPSAATPDRPG